jgi:hypothetical protein
MEVLQRKKDGTQVISVRVPSAIYTKLVELRRRANLLGFNFNATLAEVLSRASREIHEELLREERRAGMGPRIGGSKNRRADVLGRRALG